MPKATRLPSGKWRARGYYKDASGKEHRESFTCDTKKEAEFLAAEYNARHKDDAKKPPKLTVGEMIDRYIELSEPVLSPTTIYRYSQMRKTGFQELIATSVNDLTDETAQQDINKESQRTVNGRRISAKTVANEWGLVSSALKTICGATFNIKLPKRQRGDFVELPEPAAVMTAVKGTEIELPVLLALWLSFSMSEVLGLKASDIQGDVISINRVRVYNGSTAIEKNNAKVDTRKRTHKIPPYLFSLIKNTDAYINYAETGENGPLVSFSQTALRHRLERTLDAAKVQRITFHQLRHMNASVMLALNVPDKYAMERGGWKTPHVMKSVYQHTFSKERLKVDAAVNGYFERLLDTNTDTAANKG